MWKLIILLLFVLNSMCKGCTEEDTIDISDGDRHDNGDIVYDGLTYKRYEYFTNINGTRGCICEKKTCIKKCCPFGYAYSLSERNCTKFEEHLNFTVVNKYLNVLNINPLEYFHVMNEKPICNEDIEEVRVRLRQAFPDKSFVRNVSQK